MVPTRQKHLLDLLLTNYPTDVQGLVVQKSFDNLDYDTIMGHLKVSYGSQNKFIRLLCHYSTENLHDLNSSLALVPWHTLLSSDLSVDECVNVFYKILNDKIVETRPLLLFDQMTVLE